MRKDWARSLGPQNTFAIVNILAMLCTIPFALAFDARDVVSVYKQASIIELYCEVAVFAVFVICGVVYLGDGRRNSNERY